MLDAYVCGAVEAGMKKGGKPTIKDVGRMAGVSQTAVSYVLSGSKHAERISSETRDRILEAATKLGYTRNSIGAALQRGYTDHLVLLAVSWDLASSHSHTIMSISSVASSKGLSTIVHVAGGDEEAKTFLHNVLCLNPYGLILLWDSANQPIGQFVELKKQGLPIVDLLPSSPEGVVSVTADREQGFFLATKHLTDLGHRRIGLILDTGARTKTSSRKLEGYKQALEKVGVEFMPSLLQEATPYGFEAGYQGVRHLLNRHPDMTAVLCINDPMALGAVAAARDMNLDVPTDLSVVGYGATGEAAYFKPKLSTLELPSTEIAECAVNTLVKMRQGVRLESDMITVPMTLIARESTSPLKRN